MDIQFIGVTESIGIRMITKHGIRLDLVATTSSNEILNIEMQKKE